MAASDAARSRLIMPLLLLYRCSASADRLLAACTAVGQFAAKRRRSAAQIRLAAPAIGDSARYLRHIVVGLGLMVAGPP
jgi:hypothetical protein